MATTEIDDRRPAQRTRQRSQARKPRELSLSASLGICLFAAILLGVAGWIGFEVLLALITLD